MEILFIGFGFYLVLKYGEQVREKKSPPVVATTNETEEKLPKINPVITTVNLSLQRAVVCLDIAEGRPLVIKNEFYKNVDYLFCYNEFEGDFQKLILYHNWYYEDKLVSSQEVSINQGSRETWSRCDIPPDSPGQWHVDIVSENGDLIGNAFFVLK